MASTTVAPEIFDKLFTEEVQRYELVNGELRAKPMVSIFHGLLMAWLSHLLHLRLTELGKSEELWVLADPLAKIREDHWRRPDIAVIKAEDADPWKYVMPGHWPVLCIEIVSPPDQSVDDMLEKCKLYHDQGVQHCWVLEPQSPELLGLSMLRIPHRVGYRARNCWQPTRSESHSSRKNYGAASITNAGSA